jgi:pantoate--beta-alanine ligase
MEVLTSPGAMRAWSEERCRNGTTIGLVPTMGALHAGHLALVGNAADRADDVVVSIFVNPLQFNAGADFDSYPRPIDGDLDECRAAAVAAVYAPTAGEMYPPRFQTRVVPGDLAVLMEGSMRPGHFEGVATVVSKLFGAVRPDVAVFGEKDYQQLRVIEQMVDDLDMGIEIIGHPIVREPDGLAMSSRNLRLSAEQRRAAVCVSRSLDAAARTAAEANVTAEAVCGAAEQVVRGEPHARHEYTTVFDASTLEALSGKFGDGKRSARVATAVWFGDVRLIDNRPLDDR